MSLQHAAKHLAAHGRGPDTTLVHMSKGEVKSLNDLAMAHGGHLTINPHTGLPEAGFLSRMLPIIAGAALTATGIGAPVAAAIVGGAYAATSGSLKKGLMAGLGAYGGAGLAGSLGAAGASSVVPEAAASVVPEAAASVVPEAAAAPVVSTPSPVMDAIPNEVTSNATTSSTVPVNGTSLPPAPANTPFTSASLTPQSVAPAPAPVAMPAAPIAPQSAAAETFSTNPADYETFNAKPNTPGAFGEDPIKMDFKDMTPAQRFEAMKSGASFDNLGKWASDNKYAAYGMGASALMPWDEDPQQRTPYHDSDPGQQYTYEANPTGASNPDSGGRQQNYFNQRYVKRADGGFIKGALERIKSEGGGSQSGVPEGYSYDADTQQYTKMATGGISDAQYNLGGYSDGGRLLRGPGDGVSDSIPAVIGKKQPARLADGEFVVPARIVSELGNGSTEAGARKLYAMMDRIQSTRSKTVGKGKVAKNSRADRHLPA